MDHTMADLVSYGQPLTFSPWLASPRLQVRARVGFLASSGAIVYWQRMRLTVRGTKTLSSARVVDLGDLAVDLLPAHRQREQDKKLALGPGAHCGSDDATIFTNL